MRVFSYLSVISVVLLLSCVYTFSGGFPSAFRNVYIKSLENTSKRQDVTLNVQNYLFEEIQKDGRLNLVSREHAKLEIEPVLTEFRKHATEFTTTGEVTVYSITLKARILVRPIGDTTLFVKDTVFYGRGLYSVSTESEEDGIKRAVTDLVNNFLNKLFEIRI